MLHSTLFSLSQISSILSNAISQILYKPSLTFFQLIFEPRINLSPCKPRKIENPYPSPSAPLKLREKLRQQHLRAECSSPSSSQEAFGLSQKPYICLASNPANLSRDNIDFNYSSEYTTQSLTAEWSPIPGRTMETISKFRLTRKPLNKTSSDCFLTSWSSIVCQIKHPRSSSRWWQLV